MPKTITASDRASLIRLASCLPVERKAILAGLQKTAAMEPWDSPDYVFEDPKDEDDYITLFEEGTTRHYDVNVSGRVDSAKDGLLLLHKEFGRGGKESRDFEGQYLWGTGYSITAIPPNNLSYERWHNDKAHLAKIHKVLDRIKKMPGVKKVSLEERPDSADLHKKQGQAMKRWVAKGRTLRTAKKTPYRTRRVRRYTMPKTLTATDRSRLIRLASTMAAGSPERKAILAGLEKQGGASKTAYSDKFGLRFNFRDGFSFTTVPVDPPYNQTYSGFILIKKPGRVKAYRAAMAYVNQNRREIERMKRTKDVLGAINDYARQVSGKEPYWHRYLMPD